MKLANSYFVVAALVSHWALAGCSTSSPKPTTTTETGTGGSSSCSDGSAEQTPFGEFTVLLVPAKQGAQGSGENPAYTDVNGQVNDGPSPEIVISTKLPAPADATPGCAVYSELPPSCANIGGCGIGSSIASCAAAAPTGVNTCACVATDQCQAYPTAKNAGTVTVSGIADTSGATQFQLLNNSNTYQVPAAIAAKLAFPGFDEGSPITISATCGDYGPFEVSAKGVAPLQLTNGPPFNIAKALSNADAGADAATDAYPYQAFTITWAPPGPASTSRIEVQIDLSHHAGSVGHLACDVDDTGSLTISAGQISQLIGLGNIAGNPELTITRRTSGSTAVAQGAVNLLIESSIIAPTLTIEGHISCVFSTDCPSGQVCNTAVKLCQPA